LAHGHRWEHGLDEVGRLRRHPPSPAARAEAAALAGEGNQPLEGALAAPDPREATCEHATGEELSELPLDEARQPDAVRPLGRGAQEVLQVVADDAVENAVLRGAGLRGGDAHAGASQRRAGAAASWRDGRSGG
jgi:hypothetical protein